MSEPPLTPADLAFFARIEEGNVWLRSLLCTLARRGTLVRQREPVRAAALTETLSRWPWFKGGQFLFDLMEWEDFMVDGPPPPLLSTALGSRSLRRFAAALTAARALMDDDMAAALEGAQTTFGRLRAEIGHTQEALPPLEPGLHLYRDVVLGVVVSAEPIIQAAERLGDDRP
jgi:hypothetical protein